MPAQGEPTVTLLLRHGQTPMSVQKRYAGRSDVPLTDTGVLQAAAEQFMKMTSVRRVVGESTSTRIVGSGTTRL